MAFRHYGGRGLPPPQLWTCPGCGAEHTTRFEDGCSNCGAGVPGRPDPEKATTRVARPHPRPAPVAPVARRRPVPTDDAPPEPSYVPEPEPEEVEPESVGEEAPLTETAEHLSREFKERFTTEIQWAGETCRVTLGDLDRAVEGTGASEAEAFLSALDAFRAPTRRIAWNDGTPLSGEERELLAGLLEHYGDGESEISQRLYAAVKEAQ